MKMLRLLSVQIYILISVQINTYLFLLRNSLHGHSTTELAGVKRVPTDIFCIL
jgi:hypothetical protein